MGRQPRRAPDREAAVVDAGRVGMGGAEMEAITAQQLGIGMIDGVGARWLRPVGVGQARTLRKQPGDDALDGGAVIGVVETGSVAIEGGSSQAHLAGAEQHLG